MNGDEIQFKEDEQQALLKYGAIHIKSNMVAWETKLININWLLS